MSINDFTTLPYLMSLKACRRLRLLDLGFNDLTTLPPDVFEGLSDLVDLRLVGNDLNTLPDGVFDGLSALETLGLRDNDLHHPARRRVCRPVGA